jgi:DNA-binding NtrC family response regulator
MMASHGCPASHASLRRRALRRVSTVTRRPLLLVEDDAAIAQVVVDLLADEGFAVQTAGSAAEAQRLLALRPEGYALVLSDSFVQPPADPFTRLEEVRSHTTAPVVIVSAHAASLFTGWQDRGFAGLLPKPFDLDTLLDLVAALLPLAQPD